jgi:hypothetical protein
MAASKPLLPSHPPSMPSSPELLSLRDSLARSPDPVHNISSPHSTITTKNMHSIALFFCLDFIQFQLPGLQAIKSWTRVVFVVTDCD